MGKLNEINGYARTTLDKPPGNRVDLERIGCDWQNWDFGKFVGQLPQWTERNPISLDKRPPEHQKRERIYQAR